jgi:hypothetical protein
MSDAAFPVWNNLRAFGIGDIGDISHSCCVSPSRARILAIESVIPDNRSSFQEMREAKGMARRE